MSGDMSGKGKKKNSLTVFATGTLFVTFVICCCVYGSIVIPQLAEKNVRATMLPDVATRPYEEPAVEETVPEEIVKGVKNVSIDVINPGMEDGSKGGSANAMPLYAGGTVSFTVLDEADRFYVFLQDTDAYRYPNEFAQYEGSFDAGHIIQVFALSDDGWAAVYEDGIKYVVADRIVQTEKPESWNDADSINTEDVASTTAGEGGALLGTKFFFPIAGGTSYVVSETTQLRSIPDMNKSGSVTVDQGTAIYVLGISDDGWAVAQLDGVNYYIKTSLLNEITAYDFDYGLDSGEQETAETGNTESGSEESSEPAAATPAPQAAAAEDPSNTAPDTEAGSLLKMVNDLRAEYGLAPLTWSDDLASCASTRAAELPYASDEQNMSHIRPDGSEWWTVNPSIMYGENIACGQQSASEVFQAWVNSPSHKENMLSSSYTTMGAAVCISSDGAYGTYWAQEFGV